MDNLDKGKSLFIYSSVFFYFSLTFLSPAFLSTYRHIPFTSSYMPSQTDISSHDTKNKASKLANQTKNRKTKVLLVKQIIITNKLENIPLGGSKSYFW